MYSVYRNAWLLGNRSVEGGLCAQYLKSLSLRTLGGIFLALVLGMAYHENSQACLVYFCRGKSLIVIMDTAPTPPPVVAETPIAQNQGPSSMESPPKYRSRRRIIVLIIGLLLLLVAFIFLMPLPLPAGSTITLDPQDSIQELPKGTTWTTKVAVRTNQPVNAVDATITFPAKDLQVTNVDTSSTAFDVVLFEPKVDNSVGTIRFVQATPQSYSGQSGLVATVTFKAQEAAHMKLAVGTANITSADGRARNTYAADTAMTLWQWLQMKWSSR